MTKSVEVFNHMEYEIQEERTPGNWFRFDYDWLGWRAVDKCTDRNRMQQRMNMPQACRVLRHGKVWYYLDATGKRDASKEAGSES